jgi:chaperonin GroEL (HSP60 family)
LKRGVDALANAVKVTLGPKVVMWSLENHLVHQQ